MGTLKIGELAKRTGCAVQTLHYYEREGLLQAPARSSTNYRLFPNAAVERVKFIRHCRSLDIAIHEIRLLLAYRDRPNASCQNVNLMLDAHIVQVSTRIAALRGLQSELKRMRGLCIAAEAAKNCGILRSLGQRSRGRSDTSDHHVSSTANLETKGLPARVVLDKPSAGPDGR